MFSTQAEERDFHCDGLRDHCVMQARIDGEHRPDCAWILTDLDEWVRNPHWNGKGSDRHPEEDVDDFPPPDDLDAKAVAPPVAEDVLPF